MQGFFQILKEYFAPSEKNVQINHGFAQKIDFLLCVSLEIPDY
jgi:hypothetical protein